MDNYCGVSISAAPATPPALSTPPIPTVLGWSAGGGCERATDLRKLALSGVLPLCLDPSRMVRRIKPYADRLARGGGVIGATAFEPSAPSDDHPRELRSLPKRQDGASSALTSVHPMRADRLRRHSRLLDEAGVLE
eukprot:5345685-Pleurochrysis_carterae.AAC.1